MPDGGKRIIATVTNDLVTDQRMHRICLSLHNGGYKVTLVGREKSNSPALQKKPYKQVRLKCRSIRGKLFYLEYNWRLFKFLLRNDCEIINAVDLDTMLAGAMAAKRKGCKLTYDAHEYFTEVPELEGRPLVKNVWNRVAKFSIPKAHACYTVSTSVANALSAKYSADFSVIRNVPFLREDEEFKAPEDFILYQGALNKGRGLELLINLMPQLDLNLVIAGAGDIAEDLKNLVKKLNLTQRVTFTGQLPPDELRQITQKAFIGYNVLEPMGLSYRYSLSNKFFDYMHAGVPSISNPFPEYTVIVKEHKTGLLANHNFEEIAEAVHRLRDNREFYGEIREKCIRARTLFNWQLEETKLLGIYDEL